VRPTSHRLLSSITVLVKSDHDLTTLEFPSSHALHSTINFHNSLWIPFPMDAFYIRHLFHTILQYVSYRLDPTYLFCYPSFPLSFCLQLSILTLGPYSSYVHCSPVSFFAVSGCMTYIICLCPLYHFRR